MNPRVTPVLRHLYRGMAFVGIICMLADYLLLVAYNVPRILNALPTNNPVAAFGILFGVIMGAVTIPEVLNHTLLGESLWGGLFISDNGVSELWDNPTRLRRATERVEDGEGTK
jgi:hypothetical protein